MSFTTTVREVIASDRSGLLAKHASWRRVRLSEIATILNGAPFDSALFSSDDGFPLIRIRDLLAGMTSTYYRGGFEKEYVVKKGDLLIGMDGDFNSAYWGSGPALLNQRVCKVSPYEKWFSKKLLGYLLPGYLAAINQQTSAITVKHLSSRTIGEIELPLPSKADQNRIVEKLEELLSDLDAGVAELKAAQKKLARYRQSLLKAAVEGALTAEWRAERARRGEATESGAQMLARILTERRARWGAKQLAKFKEQGKAPPKDWKDKYPEPVEPDTLGLPTLPERWVWATVDQCSLDETGITDGPFGSNLKSAHYRENGPRVIRLQNIGDGAFVDARAHISDSHYRELKKHAVEEGDVIVAMLGEQLPRACTVPAGIAPAIVKADCARVRVDTEIVSPAMMTAQLSAEPTRARVAKLVKGIGRPRINLSHIRTIPIALSPKAEQHEIEIALSDAQAAIDDQFEAIELGLKQAIAQRKNILKAAFSGQLVPQDPNDEPASVLLERIRAERAARIEKKTPKPGRKKATA